MKLPRKDTLREFVGCASAGVLGYFILGIPLAIVPLDSAALLTVPALLGVFVDWD